MEGGQWAGSHEVVGKGYVFTKNREITSIDAVFTSTCHKKQLNTWPNSSASHVVITVGCLLAKGRWGHLKDTRALLDVRQLEREA